MLSTSENFASKVLFAPPATSMNRATRTSSLTPRASSKQVRLYLSSSLRMYLFVLNSLKHESATRNTGRNSRIDSANQLRIPTMRNDVEASTSHLTVVETASKIFAVVREENREVGANRCGGPEERQGRKQNNRTCTYSRFRLFLSTVGAKKGGSEYYRRTENIRKCRGVLSLDK